MKFSVSSPMGYCMNRKGISGKIGSSVNKVWENMNRSSSSHATRFPYKRNLYPHQRVDTPRTVPSGVRATSLHELDQQVIRDLVKNSVKGSDSIEALKKLQKLNAIPPEIQKLLQNCQNKTGTSGLTGFSSYGDRNRQANEKRKRRNEFRDSLEAQIQEKNERMARKKLKESAWESKKDEEMSAYNPFGRSGAGAPLKDSKGKAITKYSHLQSLARDGSTLPLKNYTPPDMNQPQAKRNFLGSIGQMHNPTSQKEDIRKEERRKQWLATLQEQCVENKKRKDEQKEKDALRDAKADAEFVRWRKTFHQAPAPLASSGHVDTGAGIALVPRVTPPTSKFQGHSASTPKYEPVATSPINEVKPIAITTNHSIMEDEETESRSMTRSNFFDEIEKFARFENEKPRFEGSGCTSQSEVDLLLNDFLKNK